MTITVKRELSFYDLLDECWSGALDTLKTIEEHDKGDELMSLLALDCFSSTPDLTEVNDLLWFDDDWVFEMLGINEEEDDEEEDDLGEDDWDNDPRIDEKCDGDRYDFPERF